MTQWEYQRVSTSTNAEGVLLDELNRLGAEGWELVGFASADRTIGFNSVTAVVRREIVPPSPRTGEPADWHPDPCGRWELRYWDGTRWTAHVADRATKATGIDPPQTLADSTAPS